MNLREFYGGLAMGMLMDGVGDGLQDLWWFYAGFLKVLYRFYQGFIWCACLLSPPRPPSHQCESQAHVIATWDFLGLESLVLCKCN